MNTALSLYSFSKLHSWIYVLILFVCNLDLPQLMNVQVFVKGKYDTNSCDHPDPLHVW